VHHPFGWVIGKVCSKNLRHVMKRAGLLYRRSGMLPLLRRQDIPVLWRWIGILFA
jgi:hypothetical protein